MVGDLSLFGVFINGGLVSALVALCIHLLSRRVFTAVGLYRLFWHPALVNLSLFVIWWGVVAFGLQASPGLLSFLLG